MRSETEVMKKRKTLVSARTLAQIGVLSAVAVVLMYVEVPLPFLAPSFYQLDFSEVPVLIGTFAMGPLAGTAIELVKILLYLVLKGTQTMFVGELGNFLIGCALIIPAGLIYRRNKTRKTALLGMAAGTLVTAAAGAAVNAFLLLPAYAAAFHMDIGAFIGMGQEIHTSVNSLFTFCLLLVAPFNLFKGAAVSLITFLIYKKIRPLIKSC